MPWSGAIPDTPPPFPYTDPAGTVVAGFQDPAGRPPSLGATDAFPRSLEDAERTAERIASIARALGGLIIAGGLAAALLAVSESERGTVVPRVLTAIGIMAGFVALAVVSLLAARTRRYRPWLAYIFAAGDGLLILLALYGGMSLSGHPGQLVFAQPPAWLIPIAVAIQAVRFRAGPLVFAAVFQLVALAVLVAATGAPATTAFGPLDTTTLFSIPADIIRGLMLAIAATVLVVSVRSKRDILIRGLDAVQRETAMSRFLPAEVSRRIGNGQSAGELAEHRDLAVLFIDLVGFTRESETAAPEAIAGWLADYRTRMNALITDNGGFVDKFIGDAVMAIFGYECGPDEAAAQACRVVAAVPAAMHAWRAEDPSAPALRAAIGGAFGPAFVGVIDAGDRREFTVVGDTVNIAARLEGFAKESEVFAALGHELVNRGGFAERFGSDAQDFALRGRQAPVRTYLVPRR